jgi:transposase-like protein
LTREQLNKRRQRYGVELRRIIRKACAKGYTHEGVARKIGVVPQSVSNWKAIRHDPNEKSYKRAVRAFGRYL